MNRPSIRPPRAWRGQRGVFALMLAPLLLGLVLCMGVVLDIAQVYNRRTELQSVADGAALAAARALNGTAAGFVAAQAAAKATAEANRYAYGRGTVTWNDDALSFGTAPDGGPGGWVAAAAAAPLTHWFARVDTSELADDDGEVDTPFLHGVDSNISSRKVVVQAVAGRTSINVAPLAICAMNTAPTAVRTSGALLEQVEYGFRRGVGYNLLALNPNGAAAQRYLINPLETPPAALNAVNFSAAVLNPFMCSGSMPMPSLPATVYVNAIAAAPASFAFAAQLNSRFGPSGGCDTAVGVADTNVRQYLPAPATSNWWGSTAASPSGQTSTSTTTGGTRYQTKADLPLPASETVTALDYGALWAFSRPLSSAGTPFTLANWPTLYPSTAPPIAAIGYPASGTPYANPINAWFTTSSIAEPRLAERRVLNVALLDCELPVGATATVLAVGRFFMTAQANANAISGEFAGAAAPAALGGPVGLFQ